jgi:hypothetical protein
MKFLLIGLVTLSSLSATAGTMVCSSASLYSSFIHYDMGTPPPLGMKTGENLIVFNRNILEKADLINGTPSNPKATVELSDDIKVLEQTGNSTQGSRISKKTAVLTQPDPQNPNEIVELDREEVICHQTWALVP